MKKLKSDKGETLVETLVSIIIVFISVAFMVTSVTVASKINARVKEAVGSQISFTYEDAEETGTGSMTTVPEILDNSTVSVKIYESNGYYYYIKGE